LRAETKEAVRAVHLYLREHGPVRLVEVAEKLNLPLHRVKYVCAYMQDYGRVSWEQNGQRFYWSALPVGIEDLL